MGLTSDSTGIKAMDESFDINIEKGKGYKVIALAGNPNVGKSTVFNELTGLNQHTGNWPGKTVSNAKGSYEKDRQKYIVVDIPGTYSLTAHSAEEECARDFVCFGGVDAVVVVCDATCLERNLNLALQIMEVCPRVILCLNLMDEARRKKINIDVKLLGETLNIPIVPASARSGKGISELKNAIAHICRKEGDILRLNYGGDIEKIIYDISICLKGCLPLLSRRFIALKLIENDESFVKSIKKQIDIGAITKSISIRNEAEESLCKKRGTLISLNDEIVKTIIKKAEDVAKEAVNVKDGNYNERDRKIDRILTSRLTGIPVMLLLLALIFYITIIGANYPSAALSGMFSSFEPVLTKLFDAAKAPWWLKEPFIDGIYRVLSWVISVMLPPMAIFFPLFTFLEDLGYLPRVAFNLDNVFKKCSACGKQALTMCMGFGCNAAGVVGCRIIDSPRERLIAIITNSFVPCNGRFPSIIAMVTMFFAADIMFPFKSAILALFVTAAIVFGIFMTFLFSKLLSVTILKGFPSSFTLELPPYRRPQILSVIGRSVVDRIIFVLGRAIIVAAPAGLIIWLLANLNIGDASILSMMTAFLDPFGRAIGLDGVIIMAFILGFPANEIVVPIMIMAYTASGSLTELGTLELKTLFINNGWTHLTAVCTILFMLIHWPCSTTCLTIKKETKSIKWTLVSFAVPAAAGVIICFITATAARLLGIS
ncbi:MAG: ferrous iron transport protein B [Lachnospiraceae bacterium]|nr:ferrous iron transport protein B [Lachnospiraceae bacterium]